GATLLACGAPLAFCSGLLQLAVLPAHGVAVPRWLVLAHGIGCALLALLALALNQPRQPQPSGRRLWGGRPVTPAYSDGRWRSRARSSSALCRHGERSTGETNHEERRPTFAPWPARLRTDRPGGTSGRDPQGAER